MTLSHVRSFTGIRLATGIVALWAAVLLAQSAHAQMAESSMTYATQSVSGSLFQLNPALVQIDRGSSAGVLMQRNSRKAEFDHASSGGDTVNSETGQDCTVFGLAGDLGAGAGAAITHQMLYTKTETTFGSQGSRPPAAETIKVQHSTVKLMVELTDSIRAGVSIRYMYRDTSVFGAPFMQAGEETRYKTTMIGYGNGFAWVSKAAAVGYAYYPPLRGKTEVYGEEMILTEPGEIEISTHYQANQLWTLGLVGKRWIHEIDDRAGGTTAADDETEISLFGLDPDQYLFPRQLVVAGAEYHASKTLKIALSAGQQQDEFNFRDLFVFNRAGPRQGNNQGHETLKYNRYRAVVKLNHQNVEVQAGLGVYSREHEFPASMNDGDYKASGQELFATFGMKL